MTPISRKLGQDELFQAIVSDFSFPGTTDSGERVWQPSKFPFEALFRKMLADEALFESLRKSQGLTYVIEKTLTELNVRQESPAGRLFYEWIGNAAVFEPPAKYEMNPESMLLSSVAKELGLTATHFSAQPDPKALVHGAIFHVLQGELIDAFGSRVFDVMRRAAFKERIKARQKEIQSAVSKTERYFGRLENNFPFLGVQRFELHYRSGPSVAIKIQENATHLANLIAHLQEQAAPGAFVGYWWRRRHLPEHGMGIHLILLTNVGKIDKVDSMTWVKQQTPALWKRVTNGDGNAFELMDCGEAGNHRCLGAKLVNLRDASRSPLADVMKSVRLMLESEKYLRLEPYGNISHWGMGELPPAAIQTSAWLDVSPVKSMFEPGGEPVLVKSMFDPDYWPTPVKSMGESEDQPAPPLPDTSEVPSHEPKER